MKGLLLGCRVGAERDAEVSRTHTLGRCQVRRADRQRSHELGRVEHEREEQRDEITEHHRLPGLENQRPVVAVEHGAHRPAARHVLAS
eukprot:scaffold28742_cov134-Isochrysis_galbana.AAC.2